MDSSYAEILVNKADRNIFCRACTNPFDNKFEGVYLFDESSTIGQIFSEFTTLQIDSSDKLPSFVCDNCHLHLITFTEFRSKCLTSDSYFREQLTIIKIEPHIPSVVGNIKEEHTQSISESDNENCSYNVDKSSDEEHKPQKEKVSNVPRKARVKYNKKQNNSDASPKRIDFICEMCDKKFHTKHRIIAHLRQHCGLKPFACEPCKKEFNKWASFRLHNKISHSDTVYEKFKCDYEGCDKSYNLRYSLRTHIKSAHLGIKKTTPNQNLICEQCGKTFTRGFFLKEHLYTHTGEKPFACTYCPKRFNSNYLLKIHIMRHENIKLHECPICGDKKTTMKELRVHHTNYHTAPQTFPCDKCPAVFANLVNIKRHIRIVHLGHKPYKCAHCQRSFSKAETLKHHVMTHTGEKPHACPICAKRFIQSIALKTHMKVHNKQFNKI